MRIVRDSPFNYEIPVIPLDQHGICNKGLALEMKRRYPHAAAVYKKICIEKMFAAGDLYAHEDKDGFGKIHQMIWVSIGEGTLNEVERAFENIAQIPKIDKTIQEIAIGGFKEQGRWEDIKFFMKKWLKNADCRIIDIEDGIKNEVCGSLEFRDCWSK